MAHARVRWFIAVVVGALLGGLPRLLHAQPPANQRPQPTQIVSANPFTLLAGWGNGEYERRLTPSSTWGVSGSFFSFDELDYRNASAIARYYPAGSALNGLFVGARFGLFHLEDRFASDNRGGAGIELGYSWLLGSAQRLAISTGGGAVRLLGGNLPDGAMLIPTARLNIGIAF